MCFETLRSLVIKLKHGLVFITVFAITLPALSLSALAATKKIAGQVTAGSATKVIMITSKGSKSAAVAASGKNLGLVNLAGSSINNDL